MFILQHPIRRKLHRASCGILFATLPLLLTPFGGMGLASDAFIFPQNFEPPGDERPEDTRGSGSRTGSCSTAALDSDAVTASAGGNERAERRIRAIAPPDNFGLTLQSHPKVFLNFEGDVAQSVMMRVQDEAGEYDQRVMLPVEPERRVQGFALPSDRPPLEVGKNYKWTILVACDGQVNPYHPIFSGWVQRVGGDDVAANLSQANLSPTDFSQQSIETQVEGHISEGYWYDAVAVLDEARQAQPTDEMVRLLWSQLMVLADRD